MGLVSERCEVVDLVLMSLFAFCSTRVHSLLSTRLLSLRSSPRSSRSGHSQTGPAKHSTPPASHPWTKSHRKPPQSSLQSDGGRRGGRSRLLKLKSKQSRTRLRPRTTKPKTHRHQEPNAKPANSGKPQTSPGSNPSSLNPPPSSENTRTSHLPPTTTSSTPFPPCTHLLPSQPWRGNIGEL